MTTELTKAAQQALKVWDDSLTPLTTDDMQALMDAFKEIRRALTQRPAAQEVDERVAFERAALAKWGPLDFERSEAVPEMYYNQRLDDAWIGFGFAVAWLRASLPAPQQATPEPFGYLRQTNSTDNPPHGWAFHFAGRSGDIAVHLRPAAAQAKK